MAILRAVNAEPVERAAEIPGGVAFAVVFAAPALLALLGLRGRPSLLVAAGVLDLGLAFVTLMSLIGLVFITPGVLFFVAAGEMRGRGGSPTRSIAAVLVAVILGTAAFLALFTRDDPICWATNATTGESVRLNADRFVHGATISIDPPPGATEAGCSSDSISTAEAVAGIALVATLLGVVWVLSKPPEPRAGPAPTMG
ncbi:MAG: hypothetical protein ACRDHI_00515 [Actinomycetota bacterium]